MRNSGRWIAPILISVGLVLSACSSAPSGSGREAPAVVGQADSNGVKSVKLTQQAFDRVGIATVPVREQSGSMKVVPYSAVLYDPSGVTWVYTVPQPLTYMREKVVVTTVGGANGTEAVLSEGPPAGTMIVSTGVIELYGAELGVGN